MNIGILKILDFQARAKRRRDELWYKFLKGKKLGYELNQDLIHKTSLLLGIKGYYSNCSNLTSAEIITHYKNLWNVEKSFRISKSDLKARPIFHNKQQAIETHILIPIPIFNTIHN